MKIPFSWIKEYLSIAESPEVIAKRLTMAGIEVDNIEIVGSFSDKIIVGRVIEAEKHPNADKLQVAKVTDGKEVYQVVCGASNCRAGLKTAFALIGATLKEENGSSFEIKKSKIRGVESFGMLCSGAELGLSKDAEGIIEISELSKEGIPISELYSDAIFEISLTPNLGHCSSVMGIVKELSAACDLPIQKKSFTLQESNDHQIKDFIQVNVEAKEGAPRYACRIIKDIQVGPSPDWLKHHLELSGLRSINNIVDITNYLLLEWGHPLHAFDYDKIQNHQIIVRAAKEGESILSLDGKKRELKDSDLVICDSLRPLAIAGVMGGSESEVSEGTTTILLEAAYFNATSIRKTSKRLGLQTDASKRFERGTDPNCLEFILNRAAFLIQKVAGGEVVHGILDIAQRSFPEKVITCRLNRVNQILGTSLGRAEVENIFSRLGFFCQSDSQSLFTVTVPTCRVDISAEIDLIEEVARIYGYDNIPRKESLYHGSSLPHNPLYLFEREVHSRLIAEGLQQFLTCDLIGPSLLHRIDSKIPAESIHVLNPTSIEQSILRTSLLPGLLQVVKYNYDHQNMNIAGFEMGSIHFKKENGFIETPVFGVILSGKSAPYHYDSKPENYDFYHLKGIIENILKGLGISTIDFKNLNLPMFHSGRQASLFVDGMEIGSMGEIHPAITRRVDTPQRIYFAEFSLHDLMKLANPKPVIRDLPLYPGSDRDWTITVKEGVSLDHLISEIWAIAPPLLEKVTLKDIYRSEKLGAEWKNITLNFFYRDLLKTVEQERVDAEQQRITQEVNQRLKLKELIP